MRIDGREIAKEIFEDLKKRVGELAKKNIIPHLVIILVGQDLASQAYVRQKELKAAEIGAKATVVNYELGITNHELLSTIQQLNNDNNIHGVIVQRPLPAQIDEHAVDNAVVAQKDVDGFRDDSLFLPPLGIAVYKILENVYASTRGADARKPQGFVKLLQSKKIVVLGKGKTGGKPVAQVLNQREIPFTVVDSKTPNPDQVTKKADIIISAVGKQKTITKENIKQGTSLIGVGMFKGQDGKLHGDYEEEDIKDVASMYTPVPGGVGPVNVAMLLENVVIAAQTS